jgi:Na+-translocating ferredoxin:NAD+ oxidoreductase RnfD subunit
MQRVLYALVPAVLGSIYFFGWRSLALLAEVPQVGERSFSYIRN